MEEYALCAAAARQVNAGNESSVAQTIFADHGLHEPGKLFLEDRGPQLNLDR